MVNDNCKGYFPLWGNPSHIPPSFVGKYHRKGGILVKEEEKKTIDWEITDPKPPVIRSGHLENRRQNRR